MALYKRPNSKFWWMKFTFDSELVQRSTKCSNKRDALTIEAAFRHELALGRIGIKPKKDAPVFVDVAKDFLEWAKVNHAEFSTAKRESFAVKVLVEYFGRIRVDAIETKTIENFIVWRSGQMSQKTDTFITRGTVNGELLTLKKIFKRLVNEEILSKNPTVAVKLLKANDAEFHVLSEDEERLYLLAAPQPLRDVAILMLQSGMRCGEVYRIRRSEVFLDKGLLKVTRGKTKSSIRQVHLTSKAAAVLRSRLQRFKGKNLFPQNDEDFRPAMQSIEKMHTRTIERLKMKFRLYDCRHTFASRAVENGIDLLTLSQILGHNGLKTISRYAHPSESYKADAIRKMENRKLAKAV